MNVRKIVQASALAGASVVLAQKWVNAAESERLPSIVFILADDLGYGDPGCYNPESKVSTPHIDTLARQGTRFTNAYCPDAVCTPSRYSLMTGRYSWRTSLKSGVQGNWERPLIEEGRLTLPQLLHNAGYVTGGFGKWHLGADFVTTDGRPPVGQTMFRHARNGANLDLAPPLAGGPLDRGFDVWYGFICASESLIYDNAHPVARIDVYPPPSAAGVDRLPCTPIADYLKVVTDRSIAFVADRAREARAGNPFFLYDAPYVPHLPLAVPKDFVGTTRGGAYGDYVHALDHHIGLLLDAMDREHLADDTLVILASDNGSQWVTTGEEHHPNAPFRGHKTTPYEGGVRTPFIVRWPGHVPADTSREGLLALTDMLATMAALTRQSLPSDAGEDSYNQLPAILGKRVAEPIRRGVVMKAAPHQYAIRVGDWKYIEPADGSESGSLAASPQLYDLAGDPGEQNNVATEHPERVAALKAQLAQIMRDGRSTPAATVEDAPGGNSAQPKS